METVLRVWQEGPSWNHEVGEEGYPGTETVLLPGSALWDPQASQYQELAYYPQVKGEQQKCPSLPRAQYLIRWVMGRLCGLRGCGAGQVVPGPQQEADSASEPCWGGGAGPGAAPPSNYSSMETGHLWTSSS